MKFVLIAAVFFFAGSARCQSESETYTDTLYVKNATAIATRIVAADSFVVRLSDGRCARLTVLDSLATENSEIVAHLQKLFPTVGIRRNGASSSVSFSGIDLPHTIAADGRYLREFSCFAFYYRQYNVPMLEMQISGQVKGLPLIVFQIGGALNLSNEYQKQLAAPAWNLPDYDQITIGHAYVGVGVTKEIGLARLNLFFNAGERRIYCNGPERVADMILYVSPSIESDLSLFISPSIEADLFNSHLRLSLGGHFFLNQSPATVHLASSSSSALMLGIGYRL